VTPELTTVDVRPRELGARAARLLLEGIAGRARKASARPLGVRLIVRGTTAQPPDVEMVEGPARSSR
jgi:DNA-binding LacI/PurR family transcriptional regulator